MKWENYIVAKPEEIETPALLVFKGNLDNNIQALVKQVGGAGNLMPHVKTHKSADILRRQMAAGIRRFKCATLQECEMIAGEGAGEVLLAYPLAQDVKVRRFIEMQKKFPGTKCFALASWPVHLELLSKAAVKVGITISVMVDLDVGMHRTGVDPGEPAFQLCMQIANTPALSFGGLHAYDGHNNQTDPADRESAAQEALFMVRTLQSRLKGENLETPRIVMGGSTCYPYYAREPGILGSPGTVVYWDGAYMRQMPDMPFRCAALVLTQVVDANSALDLATLDLGSKAISSDKAVTDRAVFPGYPGLTLVKQSEEHGVVQTNGCQLSIGDYLLAIPGHVCPTIPRYPGAFLIDNEGSVSGWIEHTARDRT
jgi:D-serine deaminase-like pyridoxal phosphate-dependent protein